MRQLQKGQMDPSAYSTYSEMGQPATGDPCYYLTQMLTGHGCFRKYLYKYKHEDSPECPTCRGIEEDARHLFFACPRFDLQRRKFGSALDEATTPENLVQQMLASKAA